MQISELAKSITKSKIRVMYDLARKKGNVLSFTVGEPDFMTPKPIIDKANEYLSKGYTKYTPNPGIIELREAIAEKFSPALGRQIDPETDIIVTVGATEAILVAMQTVMNPGDNIILADPYFTSYINQIKICHCQANLVKVTEENDFSLKAEDIEAAVNDRTRMILLNSPCNPTGAEIPREELEKIAEVAKKYDLVVISDEVYNTIRYTDEPYVSIASLPGMSERTIVINAFSKAYAMPGWRLGYAIGPKELISMMPKTHDVTVACVNAPFQYAGAFALKNCDNEVREMREKFRRRRDLVVSGIDAIPGLKCFHPKGAFYLWINIKELGMTSEEFCFGLLDDQNMAVVPGSGFGEGGEGYVRMTYASDEETLSEGIGRMAAYVEKISKSK